MDTAYKYTVRAATGLVKVRRGKVVACCVLRTEVRSLLRPQQELQDLNKDEMNRTDCHASEGF